MTQTPNLGFRGMNRTIHLQGLRLRAYGLPEAGGAGPRPGALQRGRLCGHGKQRGKCRECRGQDGGEAMGGEASGRGAREDRRAAQQTAEAQPAAAVRAVRKKCPHGRQRSK